MTINDPGGMNGNSRPGLYSYFLGTGEPSWFFEVTSDCEGRSDRLRRCEGLYGFSAAPLTVDGAVITAGLDGRLFVFDAESGDTLFKFDTAVDFETINGVEGTAARSIVMPSPLVPAWFSSVPDTEHSARCPVTYCSRLDRQNE